MLNKLNSLRDREDGFTLIELLIVVIIIGILAAIALPIFIDQQKVAIDASVQSDVRNTVTNVTNAQAAGGDVTLADSGRGSDINVNVGGTAVAKANGKIAAANVPSLGTNYTVTGSNTGGKKYTGTPATAVFTFDSSTGQFR